MTAPNYRRFAAPITLAILLLVATAAARELLSVRSTWLGYRAIAPRIATVNYYGLHHVTVQQLQSSLHLKEGDPEPVHIDSPNTLMQLVRPLSGVETRQTVEARLKQIPGVLDAVIVTVQTGEPHKTNLFVGISETAPAIALLHPTGSEKLTDSVASLYDRHATAFGAAIANMDPNFDETDSQGHAFFTDPQMRSLEDQAIAFDQSPANLNLARQVLRNAADPLQRRSAAWLITYAPDKKIILEDLTQAIRDPDPEVRNIVTRSITLIAEYANQDPKFAVRIPAVPFIEMLNSLTWFDRNKATGVLYALTESRDPQILIDLRKGALGALTEMARWKAPHAEDAFKLIGRIAGLSEPEIENSWKGGPTMRERVIATAALPNSGN